jgi:transcriptional regulator of acetoin/glycerol metabolism
MKGMRFCLDHDNIMENRNRWKIIKALHSNEGKSLQTGSRSGIGRGAFYVKVRDYELSRDGH